MAEDAEADLEFMNELDSELAIFMEHYRDSPDTTPNRNRKVELIRDYLDEYRVRDVGFSIRRFIMIIEYCLDEDLNIDDCQLMVEVIVTLLDVHPLRRFLFHCLLTVRDLQIVLHRGNVVGFEFFQMRQGTGFLSQVCNPVVECFDTHHLSNDLCQNACLFLRYGFRYFHTPIVYERLCREFQSRKYGVYLTRHLNGINRMLRHHNPFRMMQIIDTFSAFSPTGTREQRENRIRAIGYIFRSIPHPYVTTLEIFNQIGLVVNGVFFTHLFRTLINYYRYRLTQNEYFDYGDTSLQPRTLKHLNRCVIRDRLSARVQLPNGICELQLPVQLEGYLNLEW